MNPLKKLEQIILEKEIPAWAAGAAASLAATGIGRAFLEVGEYRERMTVPEPAYLTAVALLSFFFTNRRIGRKQAMKKFGIKGSSETEKIETRWPWKPWDAVFMHPKISGAAIGTGMIAGKGVFGSPQNLLRPAEALQNYAEYMKIGMADETWIFAYAADKVFMSAVMSIGLTYAIDIFSRVATSQALKEGKSMYKVSLARGKNRMKHSKHFFEQNPSKMSAFFHAHECIKQGEINEGAKYIKKAKNEPFKIFYRNTTLEDYLFLMFEEYYNGWKRKKQIGTGLSLLYLVQEFGEKEKISPLVKEISETCTTPEDLALLGWWTGEVLEMREESEKLWKESLLKMLRSPQYKTDILAEDLQGISNVYRIGPAFIKEETILKEQSKEQADHEAKMIKFVQENIQGEKQQAPKEISRFDYGQNSVLVTAYQQGKTLLQKIAEGEATFENLIQITEYLADLHSQIPLEMSGKGPINLKQKIKQALENPQFEMPEELREQALRNAEFIMDSLKHSKKVVSQDAHGGQWIFTPEHLIKVDYNDNGTEPFYRDLSKRDTHPLMKELLFKQEMFDPLQKETHKIYETAGLSHETEKSFRLSHLQAMILQSLSFASAWSLREQEYSRNLRPAVLRNAAENVIDTIKQNHPGNYRQEKTRYDSLEQVLREQAYQLEHAQK